MQSYREVFGLTVLVTGGSRGIGKSLVESFVAAGWDVAFTYAAREDAANEVIDSTAALHPERRVRAYRLDLGDPHEIEAVSEQVLDDCENLHAVVHNAATVADGAAVTMDNEQWQRVIDVNLSGPFYLTRSLLMHFLSNRYGRILFVSSLAQYGSSGQANYSAAKAGLSGLSQTFAKEYGRKGITSNVLTVGLVPTDMSEDGVPEQSLEFWKQHCPVGRVGTGQEISEAALFLCGSEAGFINGENLRVSGGLTYAP